LTETHFFGKTENRWESKRSAFFKKISYRNFFLGKTETRWESKAQHGFLPKLAFLDNLFIYIYWLLFLKDCEIDSKSCASSTYISVGKKNAVSIGNTVFSRLTEILPKFRFGKNLCNFGGVKCIRL